MVEHLAPPTDGGSNPAPPLQLPELCLEFCSAGDPRYCDIRKDHYVVKKGSHGQQVHFLVWYKGGLVGIISGGGAVYACAPRNGFFGMTKDNTQKVINGIVDNTVFRITHQIDKSACVYEIEDKKHRKCKNKEHDHYLGSRVLSLWEKTVAVVWYDLYGAEVYGFETFIVREGLMRELVDLTKEARYAHEVIKVTDPEGNVRMGNLYKASNWTYCGETSGSAKGHDGVGLTGGREGGKGCFLRKKTPKKDVYCKWAQGHSAAIEFEYKSSWKAATKEGTPEEKAIAKEKSLKRKTYLGTFFYRKGNQIVHEKFQQTP